MLSYNRSCSPKATSPVTHVASARCALPGHTRRGMTLLRLRYHHSSPCLSLRRRRRSASVSTPAVAIAHRCPPRLRLRPTRWTLSLPYFPLLLHGHAASPAEPRCGRHQPPPRHEWAWRVETGRAPLRRERPSRDVPLGDAAAFCAHARGLRGASVVGCSGRCPGDLAPPPATSNPVAMEPRTPQGEHSSSDP